MSDRYRDYKGSSRSARDDSRAYKARRSSRSRSPTRPAAAPSPGKSRRSYEKSRAEPKHYDERRRASDNWEDSDEEVPAPPPPPRITKISIGFQKPKGPIKMNLGGSSKTSAPAAPTIASVFSADDDDEPEEMPAEARMRMRNIGRETPTSAGPNSFGKTKQGFCDAKKVFEKNMKHALDTVDKPTLAKLPQTIYRINPGGP